MHIYGASPSDWDHFTFVLGLQEHLLPVVSNPNAQISPSSALKTLGQIPSLYNNDRKAAGFAKWTTHRATDEDIAAWRAERDYGICVQTRAVRALDCDIIDDELAERVFLFLREKLIAAGWDFLPVRGRENAPKFLIPFRLDGAFRKRILRLDAKNKIEFLADGQQFVAVGTHPSGVRYRWSGGLPTDIPVLAPETFESIWAGLRDTFGASEDRGDTVERHAAGVAERPASDDPVFNFLLDSPFALGLSPEEALYISCPFAAGHSKEGDKTETIYFPAGSRGYAAGHFKCMHASCSAYDDNDFLRETGYTSLSFDDLGPTDAAPSAQAADALRFAFVQIAAYAARPPAKYLIDDILPETELAITFGESGSGKSFIALDMGFAIARGTPWNGKKTQQGAVAYIAAEGAAGVRGRLRAYQRHHNIDDETFAQLPFAVLAGAPNLLNADDVTGLAAGLKAAVAAFGPLKMIIIDTFAQTTPGANENSAEDIGKALRNCRFLSTTYGCLVHLVHHAGKDLSKGARGWSGIHAAADTVLETSRVGQKRGIKVTKQKDGQDGLEWGITLEPVDYGMDDAGKILSSCVVVFTEKQIVSEPTVRYGVVEQTALNLLDDFGEEGIAENTFIARVIAALPVPEGRDTRGQRARRALENLSAKGVVEILGGEIRRR